VKMPEPGLMLVKAAAEIIELHSPDEAHSHWANERFCKGCTSFDEFPHQGLSLRVFPWSDFPKHQAELIVEYFRNSLGTR
jgi:hypothetical protein